MDFKDKKTKDLFQGKDLNGLYSINNYSSMPIFSKADKYNEVYAVDFLNNYEINIEISYMLYTIAVLKCGTIDMLSSMCDNLSILMNTNSFPKLKTDQEKKEWSNILNNIAKKGLLYRSSAKNEVTKERELVYWASRDTYTYVNKIFSALQSLTYETGFAQIVNKESYSARLSMSHVVIQLYRRLAENVKYYEFVPKSSTFRLRSNNHTVHFGVESSIKGNGTQIINTVVINAVRTSLLYPANGIDYGLKDICEAIIHYMNSKQKKGINVKFIVLVDNIQRLSETISSLLTIWKALQMSPGGIIYFSSLSYIRNNQNYLLEVDFSKQIMSTIDLKDL